MGDIQDHRSGAAAHAGLKVRKNGGSHVVIQRDGCPLEVCVPARKPIKAVYVLQLLALIGVIST